jgi:ATP-binding cassette subfamily F protein 3
MIINVSNLSMEFGERILFSNVNLFLENGQKAILLGPNGCGKTTFLKIITGEVEPVEGEVVFSGKKMGYVRQFRVEKDRTLYAEGLSVFKKALDAYEEAIKNVKELNFEAYEEYLQRAELLDVYAVEKKVKKMLKGVGFSEKDFTRRISTLSAGEVTRLQLAKLLIDEPDLLVLDEPGNYLDVYGMIFLKNALSSIKSSVLMATHDRNLIESVADEIWDMDFGTVKVYKGNYSDFLIQKEAYVKSVKAKEKSLSKRINHLHEAVERYRKWGREKAIKQAKSKEKLMDKLSKEKEKYVLKANKKFENLRLDVAKKATEDVVLSVESLKVSAGEKYIGTFSFKVKNGEKVALLGKNGVGKTTLLKKINEKPKNVTFGPNTKLAYVDTVGAERNDRTLISIIWEFMRDQPDYEVRKYLGRFGFEGDDVFKSVNALSGGEFVRFEISKALLKNPNFLIMDEPTNHLDIYMIESLENTLKSYEGTLLFSTHDLEFAKHIANRFFVMTNGKIHFFAYYEEAVEFMKNVFNLQNSTKRMEGTNDYEKKKALKNRMKTLEKKIKTHEKQFERLDEELKKVENEMLVHASDHVMLNELSFEKQRIEEEMESALKNIENFEKEMRRLEEEVQ